MTFELQCLRFYVLIQMVIRSFSMIGVFDVWMWALQKVKDARIVYKTHGNKLIYVCNIILTIYTLLFKSLGR